MIDTDTLSAMEMVRDGARGLIGGASLARARRHRFTQPGFDRTVWAKMCEAGWPSLRLTEQAGGAALGMPCYAALAEEAGRRLVPEPLVPAVLTAGLLSGEVLARHLSGEMLIVPAWQDAPDGLCPRAEIDIRGGVITASKHFVPCATGADAFLVIGASRAALVAADAPGVAVLPSAMQDGSTVATVHADGVPATIIDCAPRSAFAEAALATGAYLLGVMDGALDLTVDYLKTRVQFDRTLASFQVLQHMAVDLKLEVEVTRASLEAAATQWDADGDTSDAYASISRAKAKASSAALRVTRACIQLHGGIGFTDAHDIGLFLRKAMVVAPQYGTASAHRAEFARLKPVAEALDHGV